MRSLALVAVAFALALPLDHSLAVEITCVSTYTEADTAPGGGRRRAGGGVAHLPTSSSRGAGQSLVRAGPHLLNGPIVPGDALKFVQFLRRTILS